MTDLGNMTAAQLSDAFQKKQASPVEALNESLMRVDRYNGAVNAFALVLADRAMDEARASEERWRTGRPLSPIDGVPATIKETTAIEGIPTRKGSALGSREPAKDSQETVKRMRAAGCPIMGITTSPEFAWKGVTDSPIGGVTVNPWNTTRTSGGSSGGAAVAAALNIGVLHEGSDGAGSIRIPASFCGVVGFKPTQGWLPSDKATGIFELLHRGPISRTVRDSALYMNIAAGPSVDARYGWCPTPVPNFVEAVQNAVERVKGMRVGFARTLDHASVDPDVAAAIEAVANRLVQLGISVDEADPGFVSPHEALLDLWAAGDFWSIERANPTPEQRALMDPGLLQLVERGRGLTAQGYIESDQVRADLKVTMQRFHKRYDILMLPTMPIAAFEAGVDVPVGSEMSSWTEWSPFTYPFNMTGQPAISVPCGFNRHQLPIGVQFVGPHYRDDLVLTIAAAYQERHPEAFPSAVGSARAA